MKVLIAKIGKIQKIDLEKSSGIVFYGDIARICTIVKEKNAYDNREDKSPHRMAEIFGGNWQDYNNHFIVQAAGCPLKCPYCYVDNLKANLMTDAVQLINSLFIL